MIPPGDIWVPPMREASRIVLDGFELRTDVNVVRHPDRFMDERGTVMWQRVMALLDRAEAAIGVVPSTTPLYFGQLKTQRDDNNI